VEEVELGGRVAPSADHLRAPARALADAPNPNVTRMIDPRISIDAVQPSADCRRDAAVFHRRVGPLAERRRAALDAAHQALGRPSAVVLTMCSQGYLPLLERWLASCDRRAIEVRGRTIVAALDRRTEERAAEVGLQVVSVDPDRRDDIDEAAGFVDTRFASVMLYKHVVIHDALQVLPALLFQDVDLLWFRDPIPDLSRTADGIDLQFMYDGPNPIHRPLYANAGFIFITSNDATRSVFETAVRNSASVLCTGSMQGPLNRIVAHFAAHNLVRVAVLPEDRYLNGHLFNLEDGVSPQAGDWRSDGVVLHYSWTADIAQKLAKLDRFDLE
jgi:hypothetical protein